MAKSNSKLESLIIDVPIWAHQVLAFRGNDLILMRRELKSVMDGAVDVCEVADGSTWDAMGLPVIVWVKNPSDGRTIVHENLHATIAILRSKGLAMCPESEEAYTYLQDFLLDQWKTQKWVRVR